MSRVGLARWAGLVGLILLMAVGPGATHGDQPEATPLPGLAASYDYRPGESIVLIGIGRQTTELVVDALPTDRYGVVTVASSGGGSFAFDLVTPANERRPVFATDTMDALTGALLLDQRGTFTIDVVATGSWAIIIR